MGPTLANQCDSMLHYTSALYGLLKKKREKERKNTEDFLHSSFVSEALRFHWCFAIAFYLHQKHSKILRRLLSSGAALIGETHPWKMVNKHGKKGMQIWRAMCLEREF